MPRGVNTQDEGRIQGRNVVNANSSNIVSPGIVTDGLVLHLDAGNRVSYPTSGTVWYDLTNNRNNGTLTNGPTFDLNAGGNIITDGVNDYIDTNFTNNLPAFTIDFVFKFISFSGIRVLVGKYSGVGDDWWIGASTYIQFSSTPGTNIITDVAPQTTSYVHCTCIQDSIADKREVWINGINKGNSTAASVAPNDSIRIAQFGSGFSGTFNSNINIGLFRIYNRALTPTEVSQNFNATRARFNI